MKKILAVVVLALSFSGCGHTLNIKPIPPTPVTVADTQVKSVIAKAVGVLDALGKVTADLSAAERKLHEDGSISDAVHLQFRAGISSVARAGLSALDRIEQGVTTWAQLKALIDPLIAELNRVIALINGAGGSVKSALGQFVDGLSVAFGEALFGGAR